jgi:hypothetical protein
MPETAKLVITLLRTSPATSATRLHSPFSRESRRPSRRQEAAQKWFTPSHNGAAEGSDIPVDPQGLEEGVMG